MCSASYGYQTRLPRIVSIVPDTGVPIIVTVFLSYLLLGENGGKSITAFCYMKMPVEEEACQSSVRKPSSSPVSSMDTWRWRPSWAVAVLRANFLFIRWMMIYFNLLSQCKSVKAFQTSTSMIHVLLAKKLDWFEMPGLFGTAKTWGGGGEAPGWVEMEEEEELLMGAKIGVQRSCHLIHKTGKCPTIHSCWKVSRAYSGGLAPYWGRGRESVCVSTRRKHDSDYTALIKPINLLVGRPRICLDIEL